MRRASRPRDLATARRTLTVALVGGVAAGAGLSIALACDYSLATESASFTMAFVKIGLMPDCGSMAPSRPTSGGRRRCGWR